MNKLVKISVLLFLSHFLIGQQDYSFEENLARIRSETDSLISESQKIEGMGDKTVITTLSSGHFHKSAKAFGEGTEPIGEFQERTHYYNKNGNNIKLEYIATKQRSIEETQFIEIEIYFKRKKPYFVDYYKKVTNDKIIFSESNGTFMLHDLTKSKSHNIPLDIAEIVIKMIEKN